MKVSVSFQQGKQNQDIDEMFIANGEYRELINGRVLDSDTENAGCITSLKGTEELFNEPLVANWGYKAIATTSHEDLLYVFFAHSYFGNAIVEYDTIKKTSCIVFVDANISNTALDVYQYLKGNTSFSGAFVKFTKIGITAIQKSFLKEQYIDLIESKKQIASMTWQRSLLLDILAYGKHYLEEKEGSLKTTQEEAYRNAINEILVANPIRLIRFKSSSLEMKSKGALKIHTSEERFAIVLAVEGSVMKIVDISQKVYNLICTDFSSLVTFVGHLPITEEYKLNINKYDLMLKKEN